MLLSNNISERKLLVSAFLIFSFSFVSNRLSATHSAGADLTYKCIGGNNYLIEVTFYRDCAGINEPVSIPVMYKSAACGYNLTAMANKVTGTGQEITSPCTSAATTCNGGSITGIQKFVYQTIITLPAACADWVFSYQVCCRNCAINTIQNPCAAGSYLYVESTLNNVAAPCNNSPYFTNVPVAFVCTGQTFNYNPSVQEEDGDSLSFALISPKTGGTTDVTFVSPFSANSPVSTSAPFELNAVSGQLSFTPTQTQIGVVTIRIKEFRNGQLIGSIIRDMQVYISPCSNTLPSASGINGTNDYSINAMEGEPICFDIFTSDNNPAQNITATYNSNISGSTITISSSTRPVIHFCWTPGAASAGNTQHSFTVTVRDDACPVNGIQIFTYNIIVKPISPGITSTDIKCFGANDGIARVTGVSGGCSFLWNNGATTQQIAGLSAGTYSVSVTHNGITESFTTQIHQPDSVSAQLSATNVKCYGDASGKINLEINGGIPPYSFLWNTGQTTKDVSGMVAGTYTVTITDANGCAKSKSKSVTQPSAALSAAISSVQNVNCFGENSGIISTIVSGGTSPYSYNWSNGNSNSTLQNIPAGNYSLTVTDANGCTKLVTSSVSQTQSALSVTFDSIHHINCFGGTNGFISIKPAGGTSPYAYEWNNGTWQNNLSNLKSGSYTCNVTDAKGCRKVETVALTQPASPVSLSISVANHVSCFGGNDGAINLSASSGTPPYQFAWSNGAVSQNIQQLGYGTYTVTVTDAHQCAQTVSANITQPASPLSVTSEVKNITGCGNESNGEIDITALSGTAPYKYLWSNQSTSEDLKNIPAGNYSVMVTDASGCTIIHTSEVKSLTAPVSINASLTQPDCLKNISGNVILNPSGGIPPYTYQWSNGMLAQNLLNLEKGIYAVTVMDAGGCSAAQQFEIKDSVVFNAHANGPLQICTGELVKLIADTVYDGKYQWYYDDEELTGSVQRIYFAPKEGFYKVKVKNSCGSFQSDKLFVKLYRNADISVSPNVILCPGESTRLNAAGGMSYNWHPAEYLDHADIPDPLASPKQTTLYRVEVLDDNNCRTTGEVLVTVLCDSLNIPSGFSPNNDGINDYFVIEGLENYTWVKIWIYNRWGTLVYKSTDYDNRWEGKANVGTTIKNETLPNGTYYYVLDLNDNSKPRNGYVVIKQ